jgi:AcrR family transcriptional regulator
LDEARVNDRADHVRVRRQVHDQRSGRLDKLVELVQIKTGKGYVRVLEKAGPRLSGLLVLAGAASGYGLIERLQDPHVGAHLQESERLRLVERHLVPPTPAKVTLNTISEYGVQGTTIVRIAEGAGIAHSALYAHFENRREILLAALDAVFAKIFEIHEASQTEDAVERLREIMRHHTTYLTTAEQPSYALPLFEFIAASSDEGLGDALREKELEATRQIAAIIDEAKRQGTVSQSIDSEEIAWMLVGCAWAEDTAYLMKIDFFQEKTLAWRMADMILEKIKVPERDGGRRVEASPS